MTKTAATREGRVYIALLRGVNVGGAGLLPMNELVGVLEGLSATRVATYIQSGNAVFRSAERSPSRLAAGIASALLARRGFEPKVMVLTREGLGRIVDGNPYPDAASAPGVLHIGFFWDRPTSAALPRLRDLATPSERFHVGDHAFYLHAPDGIGRSRLAARAERALGVPMTVRNWRTVMRIRDMADAI